MPRITAEDFYSEEPPERIMGSECEYTIQVDTLSDGRPRPIEDYCTAAAIEAAGFRFAQHKAPEGTSTFLDNGGKVQPELKRLLEYCTPESLGPIEATATDLAGIFVINAIVKASGKPHNGIFRRVGYAHGDGEKTTGYHKSFLTPYSTASNPRMFMLLPTFWASSVWEGSGIVTDQYELSQKHRGIGNTITQYVQDDRIRESRKPMAILRHATNNDHDVNGDTNWARLERRYVDANISPFTIYLGSAATSLAIRLYEHAEKLTTPFEEYILQDPVAGAHAMSRDLSLKRCYATLEGDPVRVLDIQQHYVDAFVELDSKIKLPDSERMAIPILQGLVEELRGIEDGTHDWTTIETPLDVTVKLRYLEQAKRVGASGITIDNPAAVKLDLLFDRTGPDGFAVKYWQKQATENPKSQIVSADQIEHYVTSAPRLTRAYSRAQTIRRGRVRIDDIGWNYITGYPAWPKSSLSDQAFSQSWHQPYLNA